MNCLEAQNLITPFLERELTDEELTQYLSHIQTCEDCREELELYTAVYHSMGEDSPVRLYDGREGERLSSAQILDRSIHQSQRYLRVRKLWDDAGRFLIVAAEVILLICLLQSGQLRQMKEQAGTLMRSIFTIEREIEFETEMETEPGIDTGTEIDTAAETDAVEESAGT